MSRNPGSELIQRGLEGLGFDPGKIDGWAGPKTLAAGALALQEGIIRGNRKGHVETLQKGLQMLGYNPGPIDDIYGMQTRNALKLWHEGRGLAISSAVFPGVNLMPDEAKPTPRPVISKEIKQGSARYTVRKIMLHTSATPGNWWRGKTNEFMHGEIKRWHTSPRSEGGNGWRDIGYHGVIYPNAVFLKGRDYTTIGAGAINHNRGYIHLCMIPIKTIERMGSATEYYNIEQLERMREEIAYIAKMTPIDMVNGHNDVAPKLCPGFRVRMNEWL